ncbi:hypothetical protein BV20DRAFT_960777 [Pilatotrama ljubarskyi]|nr:hypothetical protein BV20DRAFT_960777 [Pilatotrama ljubarskyi]
MSCVSTPTATQFATFTTNSLSTSFTDSVSTLSPSVTTITSVSCVPTTNGTVTTSSCSTLEAVSTIGGGTTMVQVPVVVTIPITSSSPTATLFSTSCSDGGSLSSPSQDPPTTSTTTVVETTSVLTVVTFQSSFTSDGTVVFTTGTSTTLVQVATTETTTSASTAAPSPSGSSNSSAIIGGAVGGVVGAIILTLALWFLLRRKRRYNFDDDLFLHDPLQDDHSKNVLRKNGEKGPVVDADPRPYTYGALSGSAGPSSTAQTPSTESVPPPLGYGTPFPPPRPPPLQISPGIGPGKVPPPAPRPAPPTSNVSSVSAYSGTHASTQSHPMYPPATASVSTLTTSGGGYDQRMPLHLVNDTPPVLPRPAALSPPSEKAQIYLHPDRGLTTLPEGSEGSGSSAHFPRGAGTFEEAGSTARPVPQPDPIRGPVVHKDAGRASTSGVGLNDAPPAYSE